MVAEVRGSWGPAWRALWRVLRAQVGARGADPALTEDSGTLTRRDLCRAVRHRSRELAGSTTLVVASDSPRTVVVDALAGALVRRTVVVVPPRSGERALRAAQATHGGRPGIFFTTSGTTGTARVVRSRRGIRAAGQLVGLTGMLPRFHEPLVASLAPVNHGHGFSTLLMTLALGGHFVALGRDAAARLPGLGHVDVLTGVPAQLGELASGLEGDPDVGLVLSGSDLLTDRARLEQVFDAPVLDAYGTTETGTLTLDGLPLPGVRVRAVDGLLQVRSPVLGRGIFAHDAGFVRDGKVHVTGRADGVRVSAGENTSPEAIRDWLLAQESVVAVDLEERPDARFGTRLAAVVTASLPLEGEELRRAISHEFGRAATPSVVEVTAPR